MIKKYQYGGPGYFLPENNLQQKTIKPQEADKLPTAATYSQWLKGTFSYLTGIRDSDLIESKYAPSKAVNKNTKYYTRKGLDYDVMRNLLGGKESGAKLYDGTPLYYKNFNDLYTRLSNKNGKQLRTTDNSHLGNYTIGIGQDENGRYVSYYDKFDWAPKESLEIFSPYEIYNRIYEKDFNRMQKELGNEEYSGSNPSGKWFFKSGVNNKGYLKKGGLIESDNARRWKHKDGGILQKYQLGGFVNPAMAAIPYMNPNSMGGSIVQGYFNNLLNQDQILQMQQQKKLAELEEKKLKAEKQNQMFNKVLDIGSNLLTNYLNNKLNQTMSNQNLAIS